LKICEQGIWGISAVIYPQGDGGGDVPSQCVVRSCADREFRLDLDATGSSSIQYPMTFGCRADGLGGYNNNTFEIKTAGAVLGLFIGPIIVWLRTRRFGALRA